MSPLAIFQSVWNRCEHLAALHAYLAVNVTSALRPEELLRAEWVARISALDLYIHELVAQRMLAIFEGKLPPSDGFHRFVLSNKTVGRIRSAPTNVEANAAFDLEVRKQLGRITFQAPDDIADGVRLFSSIELWNQVALKLDATVKTKAVNAKALKTELSLIVRRRNQIAHEGDLQPVLPREPWPITASDVAVVKKLVESVVKTIDSIV